MGSHWAWQQYDRPTLDLPGSQQELLEAVRAAAPNKPFIVVLLHGRPLSVNWIDQNADAVITGYHMQPAHHRLAVLGSLG
jgi:beta-glucosidase